MDNKLIIALANLIKFKSPSFKKARHKIDNGKHKIDALIRVKGTVTVGKSYATSPTVSIPLKRTLALFMLYSGVEISDAVLDALKRALTDSIDRTGTSKEADFSPHELAVDRMVGEVEDKLIAELPKQFRFGPVATRLKVEVVEDNTADLFAETLFGG